MKILFTYSDKTQEGFESKVPLTTSTIEDGSVEEIVVVEGVLERVPSLVDFVEELYRLLKMSGTVSVTSKHYGSAAAWFNPYAVRGISEYSLNFSSKDWRVGNKWTEGIVKANFNISGSFTCHESCLVRNESARQFWLERYMNVAQAVLFTMIKLEP